MKEKRKEKEEREERETEGMVSKEKRAQKNEKREQVKSRTSRRGWTRSTAHEFKYCLWPMNLNERHFNERQILLSACARGWQFGSSDLAQGVDLLFPLLGSKRCLRAGMRKSQKMADLCIFQWGQRIANGHILDGRKLSSRKK